MIHELWQGKKNVFFCDSISSQFPLLQNMQSTMPLFWAATHFPGNKETVHFWKQRQRQATVNTGNGQGRTVKTSLEGKKISSLVESFESTNFINIWDSNYFLTLISKRKSWASSCFLQYVGILLIFGLFELKSNLWTAFDSWNIPLFFTVGVILVWGGLVESGSLLLTSSVVFVAWNSWSLCKIRYLLVNYI